MVVWAGAGRFLLSAAARCRAHFRKERRWSWGHTVQDRAGGMYTLVASAAGREGRVPALVPGVARRGRLDSSRTSSPSSARTAAGPTSSTRWGRVTRPGPRCGTGGVDIARGCWPRSRPFSPGRSRTSSVSSAWAVAAAPPCISQGPTSRPRRKRAPPCVGTARAGWSSTTACEGCRASCSGMGEGGVGYGGAASTATDQPPAEGRGQPVGARSVPRLAFSAVVSQAVYPPPRFGAAFQTQVKGAER